MLERPSTVTWSRRSFLASTSAALLAATAGRVTGQETKTTNPICVFTKPFDSLSYQQLAEQIAELGFDGIEAPIRSGGYIEPEAVADELPKLMEALKLRGLTINVMTSSINDANDPLTERVLKVAADLGIRFYRMQYFKYNESRPIAPQIVNWNSQMKELAALNRQLGVTGVYQNHAGRNYFGAGIWDLQSGLNDIEPTEIGVAYDIRHAAVEGGMSWPVALQMIRPHVQVVYVKDFVWEGRKPGNVPLGAGSVDPKFFDMLKKSGFSGPISLHEEYSDHRDPVLVPDHLQAIKHDFATLKTWL